MKTPKLLFIVSILFVLACTNPQNTEEKTAQKPVENTSAEPSTNPKYPNIPLAEKGITVVNPEGWKKETMEFHLNYCAEMLQKLDNVDAAKFCECFLSKIQYYYDPIYFKEAYEDQSKWNQECLAAASK
ncbi:MAG: hypothetical protein KDD49_08180 [Bacteroidetes bacterium]|nr:hypothetical protein [Bacteroidota bacterium]MCB9044396.1 hypothetical protein [Chitinophagales bacterium]